MRGRTWRVQNDDDANQDLLSCSRHGRECTTLVLAYSWLGTWAQPGALYFPLNSCPGSFITFANHSTVIDADGDGSLPLHILLVLRLMDVFKVKQKKENEIYVIQSTYRGNAAVECCLVRLWLSPLIAIPLAGTLCNKEPLKCDCRRMIVDYYVGLKIMCITVVSLPFNRNCILFFLRIDARPPTEIQNKEMDYRISFDVQLWQLIRPKFRWNACTI